MQARKRRNQTPARDQDQSEGADAAEYISSLLAGLKEVATKAELRFLAYLIGLALEEARAERTRRNAP